MERITARRIRLLLPVIWLLEVALAQSYLLIIDPNGFGDVTAILGIIYESTYQVALLLKFFSLGVVVLSLVWLYIGDLLDGGTNAVTTLLAVFGLGHGFLVYPLTIDQLNGVPSYVVTVGATLLSIATVVGWTSAVVQDRLSK